MFFIRIGLAKVVICLLVFVKIPGCFLASAGRYSMAVFLFCVYSVNVGNGRSSSYAKCAFADLSVRAVLTNSTRVSKIK